MNLRFPIIVLCAFLATACKETVKEDGWWQMRGIVLSTKELAEVDWPALAARSGINTIGTHITPSEVLAFLDTDKGRSFTEACHKHGITVEHQLHAMGELLPRELFAEDPTMFRMDTSGVRTADFNCCVHSQKALDIIAANAAKLADALRPDNHRYYFWLDDNAPVCHCPQCREFSPSEQALIVENCMLRAIREVDPEARLAHLAYSHFMDPPVKVRPDEGIFLEFAPIYRSWDVPLEVEDALCPRGYPVTNGDNLRWLEANLQVFDAEDAVVLEYWLDVSLFSRWKRPAVELPWHPEVCRSDLATYARYGIRNVTSFAVYMDAEYFERFPSQAPVEEYGAMLCSFSVSGREITVMTYNVGAFGKYKENSIPDVAAAVRAAGADIVSLNELDSCNRRHNTFQLEAFAAEMGGWDYHFASAFPFAGGGYGNGVASQDRILARHSIALPKGDGSEPRSVAVVETMDYVFASTHLDYRSEEAAATQAEVINAWFEEHYKGCRKPVLLCGDMNAEPDSPVITALSRCWEVLSPPEPSYPCAPAGEVEDEPRECIDYILSLRSGAPVRVKKAGVMSALNGYPQGVRDFSDHYPVVAVLSY